MRSGNVIVTIKELAAIPSTTATSKISIPDEAVESLFGSYDENLKHLETQFNVRTRTSGHEVIVEGDSADVARAERVLEQLAALLRSGYKLAKGDVRTAAQLVAQDEQVALADYFLRGAPRTSGKRQVLPKSVNQRKYLDAIDKYDIVFGIGPAGTGKTYLAMAQAVVVSAGEAGQPDHPGAAGGRGGREARIPAGRPAGKGQSVPAAACTTRSTT